MIIGTAGHIDHGKTTLVRALTGVDTDRLKEEKARGISIELGYAYAPLANDDILGFIDVPGHERLIHTMAAGASGIDFGLLAVAADDGIMPQTREHLAILSLLGVTQGAVALTKADRVDAARLRQVQEQVVQLAAGTFLQGMPVFPVSAATPGDAGIEALRGHLHAAAQAMGARNEGGLFRLAVDRVFTLKGHGTVVTGTVQDGVLRLDDDAQDLRLMPAGQKLRVRSIHAQNQNAQAARAGQRCALNLGGIDKDSIARGDWVADARCFLPSRNIDVHLRLLPDTAAAVRAWSPLHIHLGASHYLAHAVPLSQASLSAGESGWVQLVFDQPVCALPGDRYIARDAQARHTVGGGVVLDPGAPQRKRRSPGRLAWLRAVSELHAGGGLPALLQQAPWGLDEHEVMRLTRRAQDELAPPEGALWVATRGGQAARTLILEKHWDALNGQALEAMVSFHARWPDEPGVDTARLRRMALPALPETLWRAVRDSLLDEGRLARNGPWLHLPGHAATLAPQEAELAARLLPLIHAGGFDPPWVRDLAAQLNEAEGGVRQILLKLLRRGELYQVVRDLFYHREHMLRLARLLQSAGGAEGVAAAQFRDRTGLGRKRSIQILEFFDRAGYTRRLRDRHVLRKNSADFWQRLS
ncbi:selenocysteine-specific translation elongation factor [Pusillimonas sp. SM2304]|uniref:selenocysteine-specific translation elongation factor n=1 Tax=Pusillimonas sp. SM2304 TaxID=3073241 RepID=UPI0028768C71|nr:selenocysteine-specific translation elongation factor [Pusillimonas sp. SM2304]MDS1139075.1 selenocysteine-specific translation elongation factor [Pusillimonas sp. SM2304]